MNLIIQSRPKRDDPRRDALQFLCVVAFSSEKNLQPPRARPGAILPACHARRDERIDLDQSIHASPFASCPTPALRVEEGRLCACPRNSSERVRNSRTVIGGSYSSTTRKSASFATAASSIAYSNFCLHQGGPACEGLTIARVEERLRPDKTSLGLFFSDTEMHFVCPWHGYEYDMKTGECVSDRRLKLRKYDVVQKGDDIYVVA